MQGVGNDENHFERKLLKVRFYTAYKRFKVQKLLCKDNKIRLRKMRRKRIFCKFYAEKSNKYSIKLN